MPNAFNPPVGLGPRDQRLVAARINNERVIAETDPPAVNRHRDVDVRMRINADDHRPRIRRRGYGGWSQVYLLGLRPELARVGGQDCDGPWVQQAPIGSRPIRSASSHTISRRTMTDRSIARTEGQSGYGSGHHPPAPTGVMERPPTGRGIMLTVKLTTRWRADPRMDRCASSFSRHTSPHPRDGRSGLSRDGGELHGADGGRP